MKIFTGNFANVKKYEARGLYPVSIALSARYFSGDKFPQLAPAYSFMKEEEKEYTKQYKSVVLSRITPQFVFNILLQKGGGRDVVLLCHEKQGEFCHRRLVAQWLEENLSIQVPELGNMKGL
jgi:uncharacterized protein (DUF488 family)